MYYFFISKIFFENLNTWRNSSTFQLPIKWNTNLPLPTQNSLHMPLFLTIFFRHSHERQPCYYTHTYTLHICGFLFALLRINCPPFNFFRLLFSLSLDTVLHIIVSQSFFTIVDEEPSFHEKGIMCVHVPVCFSYIIFVPKNFWLCILTNVVLSSADVENMLF